MRVELDAFSGRPNPAWELAETDAGELRRMLGRLPTAASAAPPVPGLGYRGFLLHDGAVVTRAFGGAVAVGERVLSDPERSVERWLLRRMPLGSDVRDRIAAEISSQT